MDQTQSAAIQRIHVIFKTHLDVGFTDFSANVVNNYFHSYIPQAIDLARELRESGSSDRFLWTTGSWLIYEYLEQANTKDRTRMEEAITAGDITWHALPFTTHSELMDCALFRFGLSLSQELDHRFGKQTISAKMTDVPGHTRGIIPLLVDAGVQFLHIGVNGASTPPAVPPVFVWKDPGGVQIIVMYHKGSYGDLMVVPGMQDAIAFAHTGDNLGPQSTDQIHKAYRDMRGQFPKCEIFASTMDAFAAQLAGVKDSLPVISQEIGDTWIHGAGTDPKKVAIYRQLLRLRQNWINQGQSETELKSFSRKLLMVPEHTWGLDLKTHLNDWVNYSHKDFQAARTAENFQKMELSWQEQRNYLAQAVQALPNQLREDAKQSIGTLKAHPPDRSNFEPVSDFQKPLMLGQFKVTINPRTGSIDHLDLYNRGLARPESPFGLFWYQAFSAQDYQRFYRKYNVNKRQTHFWAVPDFTKPGIEPFARENKMFLPELKWMGIQNEAEWHTLLLQLEMPPESCAAYGAPKTVWIDIACHNLEPLVKYRLQWFEKPAFRLPEALWFTFAPQTKNIRSWKMEKLGQWVSPYEVLKDGNRHLHAIGDQGVMYRDSSGSIQIQSFDAALLAPGTPALLDFNNKQPDLRRGFNFNLYNNQWGTNFPMWYEEDALFRFVLRF